MTDIPEKTRKQIEVAQALVHGDQLEVGMRVRSYDFVNEPLRNIGFGFNWCCEEVCEECKKPSFIRLENPDDPYNNENYIRNDDRKFCPNGVPGNLPLVNHLDSFIEGTVVFIGPVEVCPCGGDHIHIKADKISPDHRWINPDGYYPHEGHFFLIIEENDEQESANVQAKVGECSS